MGRKKSKNKGPLPPDDDIIYLFIENPFGVVIGADLRHGGPPLLSVSNWIHRLFSQRSGLATPFTLWTQPKAAGIIIPVDVIGRDETKVHPVMGLHDWEDFVDPTRSHALKRMSLETASGQRSSIYICSLQTADEIVTRQYFEVNLMNKVDDYAEFLPGEYPAPYLPESPIPRAQMHLGLAAAPKPPSPPPPENRYFSAPVEFDGKKQMMKGGLGTMGFAKGEDKKDVKGISNLTPKEEAEVKAFMAQHASSTNPEPLVKTEQKPIPMTVKEEAELSRQLAILKSEPDTIATPQPPVVKPEPTESLPPLPNVKLEQPLPPAKAEELENEIAILLANAAAESTAPEAPPASEDTEMSLPPAKEEELEREMAILLANAAAAAPSAPETNTGEDTEMTLPPAKEEELERKMAIFLANAAAPPPEQPVVAVKTETESRHHLKRPFKAEDDESTTLKKVKTELNGR